MAGAHVSDARESVQDIDGIPAAGRYDAFISYSHAVDGKLAPALQTGLHRFAKPLLRLRALRVFRDEASLSANPGLWPAIESALTESRYLLLLASPKAAASKWVADETAFWRAHKPSGRLLIVLTDGELAWDEARGDFDWTRTTALPQTLEGAFDAEPRWVDLRWARRARDVSIRNPRFRSVVADVASPLHGRDKDDLIGDDIRAHRRFKLAAWSAVTALTVLLIVAAVAAVLALRARDEARHQAAVARSRQLAAQASLSLSERPDRALLLSVEAIRQWPTAEARASVLAALTNRPRLAELMWPGLSATAGPAASLDGRTVIVGGTRGRLVACSLPARSCSAPFASGFDAEVTQVAFLARGGDVAVGGKDGTVTVVDAEAHSVRRTLGELHGGVVALAASRDGRHVAAGTFDKRIEVWDTDSGSTRRFSVPQAPTEDGLTDLAFDPTGAVLAMSSFNGEVSLFALDRDTRLPALRPPYEGGTVGVAFDPRTNRLATTSATGTLRMWNVRRRRVTFRGKVPAAAQPRFSADGSHLVVTGSDAIVTFDGRSLDPLGTGVVRRTLTPSGVAVEPAAFAGLDHVISRMAADGLALWDVDLEPLAGRRLPGVVGYGFTSFAAGGRWIVATHDREAVLWDVKRLAPPRRTSTRADLMTAAVDPAGTTVVLGDNAGHVYRWRPDRPGLVQRATLGGDSLLGAAVQPGGRLVLVRGDGAVYVWELGSRAPARLVTAGPGDAEVGAISGDGRTVAIVKRGALQVLSVTRDARPRVIERVGSYALSALAFDRHGKVLAAATEGPLRIWKLPSGTRVQLERGQSSLDTIAVAPDGRSLAAVNSGGVEVWDLAARRRLGRLPLPQVTIDGAAFTADGRSIVTGWGRTAAIWTLDASRWSQDACRRVGRRLTPDEWAQFIGGDYRPAC